MWRAACFILLVGCGDNLKTPSDGGGDATGDASEAVLAHCIDSPTQIVKAPTNQLPCDLLPPGFTQ